MLGRMSSQPLQQIPLDFQTRPAMGRDDFFIGTENQDAVNWIDMWPNWPAPALILSGPAASGKSHLAAVWQDRSGAHIVNAADLSDQSAEDMAAQSETLIIDNLDVWIGDRDAETTLFHLYNIAKENEHSLLLTMRSSPTHLDFAVADLASRLRAAPLAMIHPPGDDLLAPILIKHFYDRQLQVGQDVISYILPRMERSFSATRDLVKRIDQAALAEKKAVTIPLVRRVMAALN